MEETKRLGVTIHPCTPKKQAQEDNATRARDIARASYEEEDTIQALVSSHMEPGADEDWGVRIGQLVC